MSCEKLIEILIKEQTVLEHLVEALKSERLCIVGFDAQSLTEGLQLKQKLCSDLNELEIMREEYAREMSISQWMEKAEGDELTMLEKLQVRIKTATREIVSLGQANQILMRQTQALLKNITGTLLASQLDPYDESGLKADASMKGILYNQKL